MGKKAKIFSLIFLSIFFIGGMFFQPVEYAGAFLIFGISIYIFTKYPKKYIKRKIINYFILFFLISLSFFLSYTKIIDYGGYFREAAKYWGCFLLFFSGYILVRFKKKLFKKINLIFIISLILISLYGLMNYILTSHERRAYSPLGINNNHASILIIGIMILIVKIYYKKYLINRPIDISVLIFFLFYIFFDISRGALLGLCIVLIFFFFFKKNNINFKNLIIYFLIILIFSLSTFLIFKENIFNRSNKKRIALAKAHSKLIKRNIFTGVGLDQNHHYYNQIKTKIPFLDGKKYVGNLDAHNFIIQWWAENGIISLILILTFLIYYLYKNYRKFNHNYGLYLGCLAFIIHALFSNNFHIIRLMMYFWFFLGAFDAIPDEKQRTEKQK